MASRLGDEGRQTRDARKAAGSPRPREIAREMDQSRAQLWSDITISGVATPENAGLVGKTIAEMAEARNVARRRARSISAGERKRPSMWCRSIRAGESAATHYASALFGDQRRVHVKGKAHPRLYGTFPELLGNVTRDRAGFRWRNRCIRYRKAREAAGAADRGLVKPGYFADLTVFDPATVQSQSTYEDPDREPQGIVCVIKDGRTVYGSGGA